MERFPHEGPGTQSEEWEERLEARLEQLGEAGFYNYELWAADTMSSEEMVVYQGSLTSRLELEAAGVTLGGPDCVTYAFASPEGSPLNLANDAAYKPGCTEAQYKRRVRAGANHGEFYGGLDADGHHTLTFVRFHRGAEAGEEVFITYGWEFWAETAAAEDAPAAACPAGSRAARAETATAGDAAAAASSTASRAAREPLMC